MMRWIFLSAALLFCQCVSGTRVTSAQSCSEDGAVLQAVIKHVLDARPTSTNQILVLYGRTLGAQLLDVERDLHFQAGALEAVQNRNISMESLPMCFSDAPVVVAAPSLVERLSRSVSAVDTDHADQQFAATFPRASGVYSFHLPGYTNKGRHALVHYVWTAGPLAVESAWVSLEKRGVNWTVKWHAIDWAS